MTSRDGILQEPVYLILIQHHEVCTRLFLSCNFKAVQ
jgi:hypothetical protein